MLRRCQRRDDIGGAALLARRHGARAPTRRAWLEMLRMLDARPDAAPRAALAEHEVRRVAGLLLTPESARPAAEAAPGSGGRPRDAACAEACVSHWPHAQGDVDLERLPER